MKKIYLTVLTIITVLCIIFGTIYHVGPYVNRYTKIDLPFFHYGKDKIITFEQKYPPAEFATIDVDCVSVILNTCDGDDILVSYDGSERLKPEINVTNGEFSVKQKPLRGAKPSNVESILTISLPKDKKMTGIDIDADMGSVDATGIKAEAITMNLDMGSITCDGAEASELTVDTDMGNAELKNVSFKELDASADMGRVELLSAKSLEDYSFDCSADMGSVMINGNTVGSDYTKTGSAGDITISASMGSVEIHY